MSGAQKDEDNDRFYAQPEVTLAEEFRTTLQLLLSHEPRPVLLVMADRFPKLVIRKHNSNSFTTICRVTSGSSDNH